MELRDFIIGLLFFIAATLVCFSFVIDMYSAEGYDIDLNNDTRTAFIGNMQNEAEAARNSTHVTTKDLQSRTIGQPNSNIESGSITEADMITSSLFSLTNVGTYLDIFVGIFESLGNAMGIGSNGVIVWFFVSSIIITISLILISTVLRTGL